MRYYKLETPNPEPRTETIRVGKARTVDTVVTEWLSTY
jgi:hypothetical protein